MSAALAGTATLLRLAARRDRVLVLAAAIGLTAFSVGSARATVALYHDPAQAVHDLGSVLSSPSTLALYGPATTSNLEGLSIFKTLLVGSAFVGLLAFAIVRRHTRVEEEEGRAELVGAGATGRQAPLTAAVLLAVLTTLCISGLSALGLVTIGFPVAGSLGFAAAWAIPGLAMTGITAVACQLTSTARGTTGWAVGTLGLMYAVRAVGDSATSDAVRSLRWVSPLGWVSQVFPYGTDRIWLVVAGALVGAVGVGVAFLLLERRDLGAGLVSSRTGRTSAPRTLAGPVGLVWRLTRPAAVGWVIAIVLLGLLYGGIVPQASQMLTAPATRDLIAKLSGVPASELVTAVTAVYTSAVVRASAVAMAAAGVAVLLRLAAEERTGRGEAVLATATSRARWFLVHAASAAALVAALAGLMGLVMGARGHTAFAAAPTVAQTIQTAAETVPANLVVLGAAALLVGIGPRSAPYSWGVLLLAYVLGEFGPTMNLPSWLSGLSPYAHVTTYPLASWDWGEMLALTAVALALTAAGLAAYRRRDAA